MSTNGGPPGGLPNGFNGLTNGLSGLSINGTGGHDDDHRVPPTRPSSPESDTTPHVLLDQRLAEAPSRHELMSSVPTSQPPFFSGTPAYTHSPLPARGSPHAGSLNGASGANGFAPTTPVPRSSRHLTVPGQNGTIAATLEGFRISSCTDNLLIPTPFNTPAVTPRTSPITPGRESGQRVPPSTPVTTPTQLLRVATDTPHPDRTPRGPAPSPPASTYVESGLRVPPNTPVTPTISPRRTHTANNHPDTPRPRGRYEPAVFGSPLHPTRQRGGGPKKKQKGKLTNGKVKGKGKGAVKDKMLDDTGLAVAHGESPIYTENIAAVLQHPEAVAVLSSAPDVEAAFIAELLTTGDMKDVVTAFVANGRAGLNDPDWLEEALGASARRNAGEFNAVLEFKFDDIWAEEGGEEYSDEEGEKDVAAASGVNGSVNGV